MGDGASRSLDFLKWRSLSLACTLLVIQNSGGLEVKMLRDFQLKRGGVEAEVKRAVCFLQLSLGCKALLEKIKANRVREYVKEFSSLMLDIKEMSKADMLFSFLSGFQPWAQLELQQQGVKDLPTALVAIEGLVDLRIIQPNNASSSGKARFMEKSHQKKNKYKDVGEKWTIDADKGKAKMEGSQKKDRANLHRACYICNGYHLVKNCPDRSKLDAIMVENVQDVGPDSDDPERIALLQYLVQFRR